MLYLRPGFQASGSPSRMNRRYRKTSLLPSLHAAPRPLCLLTLGTLLLAAPVLFAESKPSVPAKQETTTAPAQETTRGTAYYHLALAHTYEDMAANTGRQDYATRAVEEYKLALNADPTSAFLNNGLAELYFRAGRVRDAIMTAQDTIKREPKNI